MGRENELIALRTAWRSAANGSAQVSQSDITSAPTNFGFNEGRGYVLPGEMDDGFGTVVPSPRTAAAGAIGE